MKIQLIYLNATKEEFFPFSLGYISSILKKNNHEINVVDTTFSFNEKKIIKEIEKFNPNVIGISSTSGDFPYAIFLKNKITKEFSIPIVLGGVHATVTPDEAIRYFDIICIGEGEYALLELLKKIKKNENIFDTKNFWFRNGEEIIKNPPRPLIQDLDLLPFPDRKAFDFKRYLQARNYQLDVIVSRGCPFTCSYCINPILQKIYKGCGSYVRVRSVGNIVAEIKEVMNEYKIKSIQFHDDIFPTKIDFLKEFARIYPKEIGLPFQCNSRAELLTEKIIKLLKKSGCEQIDIGIESGNERIRKRILKRYINNERIIKVFKLVKKMGIRTKSYNMIGIPFETEENILETIELNKKIQPDDIQVTIFTAYKGTELYEICEKNGWLETITPTSYYTNTNVSYSNLPREKIKDYYRKFVFYSYSKTKPIKALIGLIKVYCYPLYTKFRNRLPIGLKRVLWSSRTLRA